MSRFDACAMGLMAELNCTDLLLLIDSAEIECLRCDPSRHFKLLATPATLMRSDGVFTSEQRFLCSGLADDALLAVLQLKPITHRGTVVSHQFRFLVATKKRLLTESVFHCSAADEYAEDNERRCMMVFSFSIERAFNNIHIADRAVHRSLRGRGVMTRLSLVLLAAIQRHYGDGWTVSNMSVNRSTAKFMATSSEDLKAIEARCDEKQDPASAVGVFLPDEVLSCERPLADVLRYQNKRLQQLQARRSAELLGRLSAVVSHPDAEDAFESKDESVGFCGLS